MGKHISRIGVVILVFATCGCAPSRQERFQQEENALIASEHRIPVTAAMRTHALSRYEMDAKAGLRTPLMSRVYPPELILASYNDNDHATHTWAVGPMDVQN